MVQRTKWFLPIAVALAGALSLGAAASAVAAPPPLTPSIVGESPTGGGVFRFPQAVAIDPHDGSVVVGDQYSGQIQVFSPTGQFKFALGALGSRGEEGRMNVVGGVAVDRSRHIYVLDSDHDRVQIFSARDGRFITAFGDRSVMHLFAGPTREDHGITASGLAVYQASPTSQPIVYVADSGNSRLEAFTLDLSSMKPVGAPRINTGTQLQWPQGVAFDRTGKTLYVADNQHHRVVVIDAATMASTTTVGINGTGPGQFNAPYDVAIDGAKPNRLYVADNLNGRVNIFDAANLGYLGTLGGNGHRVGLFSIVRAIASNPRDKTGGITVADTANNRIQRLDRDGNVTAAWGVAGRSPGYVTRARGVAVSPDGGIAVGDTFDHRIELFGADGTYIGQHGPLSRTGFAAPADTESRFLLPESVAYDQEGYLWVSDSGNHRVKRISPTGQTVLITPEFSVIRPRGIAIAPDGSAYVADSGQNALLKIGVDGSVGVARSGLKAPFGAAWGGPGNGSVWVATSTGIYDALGTAKIAPPLGAKTWERPDSLTFADDGTLYVSETRTKTANGARVLRGTPDGNGGYSWDVVATEGAGPGQVIDPGGLSLNADGTTLYVADAGNNRVLRFDAPGQGPAPMNLLTTTIEGGATRGAITSPIGIDCETDCFQHLGPGRQTTLTVTTFDGSIFEGWTGACAAAGTAPTCTITMNGDQTAGARFKAVPPPPVKITAVKASPTRWHRARPAKKKPKRAGVKATKAQLTVSMSQPANVTMTVQIAKPGQLVKGVCKPLTSKKKLAKSKRCTRYANRKGSRKLRMTAGNTVIAMTPQFAGKTLAPGLYKFAFKAKDDQGNVSTKLSPRVLVTK